MTQIIPIIKELKVGNRANQLFYLAFLKEMGQLGKRLHKILKNEKDKKWLAKFLFDLSSYIQNYEL